MWMLCLKSFQVGASTGIVVGARPRVGQPGPAIASLSRGPQAGSSAAGGRAGAFKAACSLEVVRVRDEAPPARGGERLVARPAFSEYLPLRVNRVPVHSHENRMLAQLTNFRLNAPPADNAREAIGLDHRGEVIPHGVAVWQMDCLAFSDREEWPKAEVCQPFRIAFCVADLVLV